MNGIFIIPTGIGCEIGGHAGDATPAVNLIASVCDKLIVNPNAVNASDINEMRSNCLYVEGSTIDRFLEGQIYLKEVRNNKILVAVNSNPPNEIINSVSAARATLGIDAEIVVLNTKLFLNACIESDGTAGGFITGEDDLIDQVKEYDFDALAIATPIHCYKEVAMKYFENGGVNPYGAVEALASGLISKALNKPVAHAPIDSEWFKTYIPEIVDPRMAAEMVTSNYVHCILKGLHKAPRIIEPVNYLFGFSAEDIDFMVSPWCWGVPHKLCEENNIPVIMVRENKTVAIHKEYNNSIWVDNYFEAAGIIQAMNEGINPQSIRRPLQKTNVI